MSAEFPLPDTGDPATAPFWQAAARGELALPRCAACGRIAWYPRESCARCEGIALPWTPVSGRARLFSWAVVERAWVREFAAQTPYVTGLVSLEEDPSVRLVTLVVDCAPGALRVDMPVRAVFRALPFPHASPPVIAPMFAPAA